MGYKIGSFNLLHFSLIRNKKRDDEEAVKYFSNIIKKQKFDLVALQEIETKTALNSLLFNLGLEYDGFHASNLKDIINPTCSPNKEYAFVWRKKRLKLIDNPQFYSSIYEKISKSWGSFINIRMQEASDNPDSIDDDLYEAMRGKSTQGHEIGIKNNNLISEDEKEKLEKIMKNLIRPPLICGFRPTGVWSMLQWELRVINTHIIFGKGKEARKDEIEKIKGDIYTIVNTLRFGDFRSVYVIVAGDYNLELKDLSLQTTEGIDVISIQKEKTTVRSVDTNSKDLYKHNFDHFSFAKKRVLPIIQNTERIDFENHKEYREKVSDHVPISTEIKL